MAATALRHIASLDGIRAAAAMLVFSSHAFGSAPMPGGLGVTVFFFLSGFLITTLLRREREACGSVSLRRFYLRRACRIFPPMYFMLIAMLLFAMVMHEMGEVETIAVLAQFLHLTNYYIVVTGSDAGLAPHTSVLWSLAVEEHFYLVFPMLFLFLSARMPLRRVAATLGGMCVLVLMWRIALALNHAVASDYLFYSTDTRLDSLLFGCIMGVWCNPVLDAPAAIASAPPYGAQALLLLAVALLLGTLLYRAPFFQKSLRYSLQGIALFPMFWLAIRYPGWCMFRWLNWKPVRWLGSVSYSFYLAHPFWLHVAAGLVGDLAHGFAAALLGFLLTAVFSALLYRQLERPFLQLGHSLGGAAAPPVLKKEAT
ncbi:acyltransferase family protein [Noviherbaspirillum suwonense]|jgi:peptidoglycan/LPS O-acetylase OafA/YrhL|uniref:Peptidoglycan/LPS O-acetylase OafA/YrhL, contains acyltransferase and SGNH-hydrolase domains n=1 Tax=Noviherbaspirillum suwonense TaxID=1224511 RepID=A0ABY1QKF1_9BURK|nr:acyltransferase [Noviherbaspirillum suwonense]SMP70942.1 Peptidoglycan/LPS O-acetylase OafA/YrhL, contains acyltransferase and SGNH-hydrolase domains [Noviherbaspirillum suwonense]